MHIGALDKTLSHNTSWKASGENPKYKTTRCVYLSSERINSASQKLKKKLNYRCVAASLLKKEKGETFYEM